jgi:hypothetical protein
MYLWNIAINDDSMSITFKRDTILHFCVGAPTRRVDDNVTPYYIVTSNWEELVLVDNDTCFQSPAKKTNLENYS